MKVNEPKGRAAIRKAAIPGSSLSQAERTTLLSPLRLAMGTQVPVGLPIPGQLIQVPVGLPTPGPLIQVPVGLSTPGPLIQVPVGLPTPGVGYRSEWGCTHQVWDTGPSGTVHTRCGVQVPLGLYTPGVGYRSQYDCTHQVHGYATLLGSPRCSQTVMEDSLRTARLHERQCLKPQVTASLRSPSKIME